MWYMYRTIPVQQHKEWTTDIVGTLVAPQKHHAKGKKSCTKEYIHIVYSSTDMKRLEDVKLNG